MKLSVEAIALDAQPLPNKKALETSSIDKAKSVSKYDAIYTPKQCRSKWNFSRAYSSPDIVESETMGLMSNSCPLLTKNKREILLH